MAFVLSDPRLPEAGLMHGALMLTECSTVARLALHKSCASQLCNAGNIPRVKLKMVSSRNIAYLNVLITCPTNTCISKAKLSCCKSRLCSKAPCPHGGIQGFCLGARIVRCPHFDTSSAWLWFVEHVLRKEGNTRQRCLRSAP